jgi:hypothetical protein
MDSIKKLTTDKIDSCLNSYREVFSDPLKSGDDNAFNPGVILPLDFSLEMDGLSGIIPHSAFVIPSNSLPSSYKIQTGIDAGKQKIAFILHTIEQNFGENKWTTKITGQTLSIRFEPLTEAEKAAIKAAKDKQKSKTLSDFQNVGNNGSQTSSRNKQAAYDKMEVTFPGFKTKLRQVATNIGVTEDVLVTTMYKESGIRTDVRNSIGCVGLIQFCPDSGGGSTKTIKGKTYSLGYIQGLDGVRQLDVVEAYFKSLGFSSSKPASAGDLYIATFYPLAKNKPQDFIIGSEKSAEYAATVAKQNPGIAAFSNKFLNGKKVIDKAAFEKYVYS